MTAAVNQQEMRLALARQEILLANRNFLGKGSFSVVLLGYSRKMKRYLAIKLIDTSSQTEYVERFLPRELNIVSALNHPNCIKVYKILRTDTCVALLQEYAAGGDLLKLITTKKKLDEQEARFLFRQLIEAIRYLSINNIVHRDIKCENLMLDAYKNIKLGDFGFARFLQEDEDTNTHCGSRAYTALELLQGKRYKGNGTDIWSAGVVLFIMLSGRMPFDERNPKKMLYLQTRNSIPFTDSISKDARDLIRRMLSPDVEVRASVESIIAHNWMKGTRYFMRGFVETESETSTASDNDEE